MRYANLNYLQVTWILGLSPTGEPPRVCRVLECYVLRVCSVGAIRAGRAAPRSIFSTWGRTQEAVRLAPYVA